MSRAERLTLCMCDSYGSPRSADAYSLLVLRSMDSNDAESLEPQTKGTNFSLRIQLTVIYQLMK